MDVVGCHHRYYLVSACEILAHRHNLCNIMAGIFLKKPVGEAIGTHAAASLSVLEEQ